MNTRSPIFFAGLLLSLPLALPDPAFADLDFVYNDGSSWQTTSISDDHVVDFAYNDPFPNLVGGAPPLPSRGGTFGITNGGDLIWITGDAGRGFNVDTVAAGQGYVSVAVPKADRVVAVGSNGVDGYIYNGATSMWDLVPLTDPNPGSTPRTVRRLINQHGDHPDILFGVALLYQDNSVYNWFVAREIEGGGSNPPELAYPAAPREKVEAHGSSLNRIAVVYADGGLEQYNRSPGDMANWVTHGTCQYEIPSTAGKSPYVRVRWDLDNGHLFSFSATDLSFEDIRSTGKDCAPPPSSAFFANLTETYTTAINTAPIETPVNNGVVFSVRSSGAGVDRLRNPAFAWRVDNLIVSTPYETLGRAGALDEFFGSGAPHGATSIVGDCNQDGTLDLSDVICLLGHLFQGNPQSLPCTSTPANRALMDCNQDNGVDLSDAIYKLAFLFQGGLPPKQGEGCIEIVDCPQSQGCP